MESNHKYPRPKSLEKYPHSYSLDLNPFRSIDTQFLMAVQVNAKENKSLLLSNPLMIDLIIGSCGNSRKATMFVS